MEGVEVAITIPEELGERVGAAISRYNQVANDFKDTAHGKQAKERASYLEKNRAQVAAFYDQMANRSPLDIGELIRQMNLKKDLEPKDQPEPKEQKK